MLFKLSILTERIRDIAFSYDRGDDTDEKSW